MLRPEVKTNVILQGLAFVIVGVTIIYIGDAAKGAVAVHSAGVLHALIGDLTLILPISLFAVVCAIACAFYLEEWLPATHWVRRFVESQVALLGQIPSLLYGVLVIALPFRYTALFNGSLQNMEAAGLEGVPFQRHASLFYLEALIFSCMVVPVAFQATQAALRSVARPVRESAYALGANRWQVLSGQVMPLALFRVIAGACRAMSRAFAAAALVACVHAVGSEGAPDRFMLFLGGSLLLGAASSFLIAAHAPALTGHD